MQVTRMGDALRATGRPIFYSTEMGGANFGPDICNSAREGSDISASWERILYELDVGSKFAAMAGPGFHNDFDMLGEVALFPLLAPACLLPACVPACVPACLPACLLACVCVHAAVALL